MGTVVSEGESAYEPNVFRYVLFDEAFVRDPYALHLPNQIIAWELVRAMKTSFSISTFMASHRCPQRGTPKAIPSSCNAVFCFCYACFLAPVNKRPLLFSNSPLYLNKRTTNRSEAIIKACLHSSGQHPPLLYCQHIIEIKSPLHCGIRGRPYQCLP
jgi:hypothetical protein